MIKFDERILKIAKNMNNDSHNDIMILGFGNINNKIQEALIINLDKFCEDENISTKWNELSEDEQDYIIIKLECPDYDI